jgi:putative peptidoglycan lipid II flippase
MSSIVKSTIQITILSFVGIVIGFATQLLVAYFFGTTPERDAYFAATVIPVYLSAVIIPINSMFLPMYMDIRTKQGAPQADKFFHTVATLSGAIGIAIAVLCALFAGSILSITAPGFEGGQKVLATELLIILLPNVFFQTLTNITSSVLQTQHRFLIPAIAPVLSTIIMLLSVSLFHTALGIHSLAYATLMGSAVSYLMVRYALHKPLIISFAVRSQQLHELLKCSLPLIAAGVFYQLAGIIERAIGSTLPEGSISYLGYATQIMTVLQTIIVSGITISIYPYLSEAYSRRNHSELNYLFTKGMRGVMLLSIPIAAIFALWGTPIIRLVLERGAFTPEATVAVSSALAILMGGFVAYSVGGIINKMFYISRHILLACIYAVLSVALYIALAYFLSQSFSYKGLAAANSISGLACVLGGLAMLKVAMKLHLWQLFKDTACIALSTLLPAGALYAALAMCQVDTSVVSYWAIAVGLCFPAAYYLLLRVFKIDDLNWIGKKLLHKIVSI